MNTITWTGPRGTDPLGWLCSVGALRVIVDEGLDPDARLAFDAGARPVLHTRLDKPAVTEGLVAFARARVARPELTVGDVLKFGPPAWADVARDWRTHPSWPFAGAYTSDLVTAGSGDTKPTALDMTAGQQKFLAAIRSTLEGMTTLPKPKGKAAPVDPAPAFVDEALYGPWRRKDDVHALGWDPSGEGLGAFTPDAPAKMPNESVRAAVWLAFEALPLFPVFAVPSTWRPRLETTGFHREDGEQALVWPVWRPAITLDAVRVLLGHPDLPAAVSAGRGASRALAARGVTAVCRSVRADLGDKGYAILRSPLVLRLDP